MNSVALIGLGSLGCEALKNILDIGVNKLALIDFDTVDQSNLNKCFYFTKNDIGKFKVNILSQKINKYFPKIQLKFFVKEIEYCWANIQNYDFFIISVDNVKTRLYCNQQFHLKCTNNQYLIDLGTEWFVGHIRIIQKDKGACLACYEDLYLQDEIPINNCTLNQKPKRFEDCINKAVTNKDSKLNQANIKMITQYINKQKFTKFENNFKLSEDQIYIYHKAVYIAIQNQINIKSKNFFYLFQRNFIQNLSSTNSVIASKMKQIIYQIFNQQDISFNNFFINLESSYNENNQWLEKNEKCLICNKNHLFETLYQNRNTIFKDFYQNMQQKYQQQEITIFQSEFLIYHEEFYKENFDKMLFEIIKTKQKLQIHTEKKIYNLYIILIQFKFIQCTKIIEQ